MKTFKEQKDTLIIYNDGEQDYQIDEYSLRKMIRDFIYNNTPNKNVLERSPYGEGMMYQYYCENRVNYLHSDNDVHNLFISKINDHSEYDSNAFNIWKMINEMINEELVNDYKKYASIFSTRKRKELKVKEVFADYPKSKPIHINILQLN